VTKEKEKENKRRKSKAAMILFPIIDHPHPYQFWHLSAKGHPFVLRSFEMLTPQKIALV